MAAVAVLAEVKDLDGWWSAVFWLAMLVALYSTATLIAWSKPARRVRTIVRSLWRDRLRTATERRNRNAWVAWAQTREAQLPSIGPGVVLGLDLPRDATPFSYNGQGLPRPDLSELSRPACEVTIDDDHFIAFSTVVLVRIWNAACFATFPDDFEGATFKAGKYKYDWTVGGQHVASGSVRVNEWAMPARPLRRRVADWYRLHTTEEATDELWLL